MKGTPQITLGENLKETFEGEIQERALLRILGETALVVLGRRYLK